MAKVSTVNNSELLAVYYDNVFLERMKDVLILNNWADKKNIPLWSGKQVSYFSYYPIAEDASPITEGSSTANEVTIAGQTITATVAKYAQWAPYTEMIKLVARDRNLEQAVGLFGEAAGRSLELALATELFQKGSIPIRVDELKNSATWTYEGTTDWSNGNSTTVFVDAAVVKQNDHFNQAHWAAIGSTVTNTGPRNYRHGSLVTDYASPTDAFTLTTAAPVAFSGTTDYRVVSASGLTASNPITGTAINYAVSKARENNFYTFPGGWLNCALAAQVESDLQKDAVYRNLGQYQQAEKLEKGFIGSLWGVQFYRHTKPYRRTAAAGAYSASGAVFCTPVMGMHALGNVSLSGMRGPVLRLKSPGPQTTNEPYDENGTMAYKFYAAPKALNAAFAINILSGATGVS